MDNVCSMVSPSPDPSIIAAARPAISTPQTIFVLLLGSSVPFSLYIPSTYVAEFADETIFLKLNIPNGKYILANNEVWDFMINHLYFPKDKEDELAHEAEIERYGISSPSSLVGGSAGIFYPILKQKVIKSWSRVFSMMPDDSNNIVGLCWELHSEWLIECK